MQHISLYMTRSLMGKFDFCLLGWQIKLKSVRCRFLVNFSVNRYNKCAISF